MSAALLCGALASPSASAAGMLRDAAWQLCRGCLPAAAAAAAVRSPSGLQQAAGVSSAAAEEPPFKLGDLLDLHCGPYGSAAQQASPVRVLQPGLRNYGGLRTFYGRVTTIQCQESNVHLHAAVKEDGAGRVLVVDNGGSMRSSLLGDILARVASKHGWSGIVVNGCIRDAATVHNIPLGLRALDTTPMKPGKGEPGQRDVPVVVSGTVIFPGDWLYSDEDGVLVSPEPLEFADAEQLEQVRAMYRPAA